MAIEQVMTSRRFVLRAGVAAGGGLLLDLYLPALVRAAAPEAAEAAFAPNAFIRIDKTGAITLIMRDTEVGQGIYTSVAMLIAEELEVGLDQLTVQAAPPDVKRYANPLLGDQATGGSASIRAGWVSMREAGSVARTMLVAAAAVRWGVDPAGCTAARAVVTHAASGRSLGYGDLAEDAARQPIPAKVALKPPGQFKLIGTSPRRLDTPAKVNGSMVFGIDVKVPGMGIGTVAASPVKGGRVLRMDEAAARKVPGVRDVVRLDDVVAVIADHMWSAMKGLAQNPSAISVRA